MGAQPATGGRRVQGTGGVQGGHRTAQPDPSTRAEILQDNQGLESTCSHPVHPQPQAGWPWGGGAA
jgi:hypothetical protein